MEQSGADMAFCGHDTVSEDGAVIRPYSVRYSYLPRPAPGVEALVEVMREKILPWTGSTIYRKRFLDEMGLRYTEGRTYAEDIEFIWKAMFYATKVASVNQVLSYYVQRAGSATGTALMRRFRNLRFSSRFLICFPSKIVRTRQ